MNNPLNDSFWWESLKYESGYFSVECRKMRQELEKLEEKLGKSREKLFQKKRS